MKDLRIRGESFEWILQAYLPKYPPNFERKNKQVSQQKPTKNKQVSQQKPTKNKQVSQQKPTKNKQVSQQKPTKLPKETANPALKTGY